MKDNEKIRSIGEWSAPERVKSDYSLTENLKNSIESDALQRSLCFGKTISDFVGNGKFG